LIVFMTDVAVWLGLGNSESTSPAVGWKKLVIRPVGKAMKLSKSVVLEHLSPKPNSIISYSIANIKLES
jgi:hypothetical protein